MAKGDKPVVNHTLGNYCYVSILAKTAETLDTNQTVNAKGLDEAGNDDGSRYSGPIVQVKGKKGIARLTCTKKPNTTVDGSLVVTITNSDGTAGPPVDNIDVTYVADTP